MQRILPFVLIVCATLLAQGAWYWPVGTDEDDPSKPLRLHRLLEEANNYIEIAEDDIEKGLERIAAAQREPTTTADVRKRFEENGNMEIFKDQLKAEKALDLVLAEAK